MEGTLHVLALADAKKAWLSEFVKFDDISAQLVGFVDRSQAEVKWRLHLKGADVATPLPGEAKHSNVPGLEDQQHCFYVHEVTSCGTEVLVYLAADDDETKKRWMKRLMQAANDGPMPPRFGTALSPRSPTTAAAKPAFLFQARVTQVRLHEGGKHAEYMVTCHCEIFSRVADRRLAKEWNVWHRFSEFDALNEALKISLGVEKLADVPFYKTNKDALRSLFGWWSLDQDFLDHRRLQLDTFVTRVSAIEGAVDFFQPRSDSNLKAFFAFDANCEDVDHPTRKTSHSSENTKSPSKQPAVPKVDENLRTSDMSPRDSDTSASFSSAIMSPVAAPVSPTKTVEQPSSPVSPTAEDTKKETRRGSESNRGRNKKDKEAAASSAVKTATATVPQEAEIVRQPTHTGGKKGKKSTK